MNMHTLNRAHPRDMTVGKIQNNDQLLGLRRFGSVQMGSGVSSFCLFYLFCQMTISNSVL